MRKNGHLKRPYHSSMCLEHLWRCSTAEALYRPNGLVFSLCFPRVDYTTWKVDSMWHVLIYHGPLLVTTFWELSPSTFTYSGVDMVDGQCV